MSFNVDPHTRRLPAEAARTAWRQPSRTRRAALRCLLAVIGFIAVAAIPAVAQEVKLGGLTISDLWARATPPKAPSAAGYLTITNSGTEPDRLIGVTSPIAGKAELHQMAMKNGVMTMRPVEGGIPIPQGGKVDLTPDGLHVMFTELKQSLKQGDKVPVTLTFEKAGKTDAFLSVLAIGAKGPQDDMGGMKM